MLYLMEGCVAFGDLSNVMVLSLMHDDGEYEWPGVLWSIMMFIYYTVFPARALHWFYCCASPSIRPNRMLVIQRSAGRLTSVGSFCHKEPRLFLHASPSHSTCKELHSSHRGASNTFPSYLHFQPPKPCSCLYWDHVPPLKLDVREYHAKLVTKLGAHTHFDWRWCVARIRLQCSHLLNTL
jgi:hypothetical protein